MMDLIRRAPSVALLASFAAGLCCVGATEADEVGGIVAVLKGNVRVQAADGSVAPIAAPQVVHRGDKLLIAKGARAVIFQQTQPPISLTPGTELTMGPGPVPPKAKLQSPAIAALWNRLRFGLSIDRFKRLSEAEATTVARQTERTAKPSDTCITTPRPKFSWSRVSGVRSYAFNITETTDTGEKRVYNGATAKTRSAYPDTASALSPGTVYRWEAIGGDGRRDRKPQGGWIVLLAEEEIAVLREAERDIRTWAAATKEQYGAGLLLAERYCSDGLYELAHAELKKLARAEKADPIVTAFLADIDTERRQPPGQ